jgi:hypothetical protein
MEDSRISATFRFYPNGKLKAVFLNTENDEDQEVLEKALEKLIRPERQNWLHQRLNRCM